MGRSKGPYKYWKTEGFFACLYSSMVYTEDIILVYFSVLMLHLAKKSKHLSVLEILFKNGLFCGLDGNSSNISLIVEWKPNAQKASNTELSLSLYLQFVELKIKFQLEIMAQIWFWRLLD